MRSSHSQDAAGPRPDIVAYLRESPDGVLERVAEKFSVSTFEVVEALSSEYCVTTDGARFDDVMADLTSWGVVLVIVHTPNIVLECKGPIPVGSHARGYYNIHGDSPIGGHIKADRCARVAFVSRPFMGRQSYSIQFFDRDGEVMFKVFVARDADRNLCPEQVDKFEELRLRVCQ